MVKTWSEDEDSRRLLAFLNLIKALSLKKECAGLCIKLMFVAFVRNCKFVLASNIAQINLMRECLLELFGKNLDDAYVHAFVYTRQLAITLRKAYNSKNKVSLLVGDLSRISLFSCSSSDMFLLLINVNYVSKSDAQ